MENFINFFKEQWYWFAVGGILVIGGGLILYFSNKDQAAKANPAPLPNPLPNTQPNPNPAPSGGGGNGGGGAAGGVTNLSNSDLKVLADKALATFACSGAQAINPWGPAYCTSKIAPYAVPRENLITEMLTKIVTNYDYAFVGKYYKTVCGRKISTDLEEMYFSYFTDKQQLADKFKRFSY